MMLEVTRYKVALTMLFASISFLSAGALYRLTGEVVISSYLFFPIRIHLWLQGALREPGYQDIMHGECIVPLCDSIALIIAICISLLIYYLAAVIAEPLIESRIH